MDVTLGFSLLWLIRVIGVLSSRNFLDHAVETDIHSSGCVANTTRCLGDQIDSSLNGLTN